jgi:eukaryotic-like serine/threonine-protein kinase
VLEAQVLANGSTLQKSDLFQCTCARLLAANAYSPSQLAADYAKRALLAIEQDRTAAERLPEAQMIAAFPLLWLNPRAWSDAVALMEEAEKGALWLENAALLAQVRTYLAIGLRRLGKTDSAERVAAIALTTAQRCGSPGYIGAALATEAWVAWKRGALTQAAALVREARQYWKDGQLRHPFQCFLNFVWVDLLRHQEKFEEAQQRLNEVLAPDQHRLPDSVLAAIEAACSPGLDAVAVDRALSAVSRAAAAHAYL